MCLFYMKKYFFFIFFLTIILILNLIVCNVPKNYKEKNESTPDTKHVTCVPTDYEIIQRNQKHVEWVRCLFGPIYKWCKNLLKIKIPC